MTGAELRRLPISALHRRRNSLKRALATFTAIIVLLFAAAIVLVLKQGFQIITLIPLACMPGHLMVKKWFDDTDDEIRARLD